MTTPTYTNGFGGHVTFASAVLEVTEWQFKADNGLIDVTNTGSSNWGQFINGVNSGQVDCKGFFDTTTVQTGTPNVLPGASGTLALNIGATGKQVTCTGIVMSVALGNSPAAGVTFDFSFKLTSAPVYPT